MIVPPTVTSHVFDLVLNKNSSLTASSSPKGNPVGKRSRTSRSSRERRGCSIKKEYMCQRMYTGMASSQSKSRLYRNSTHRDWSPTHKMPILCQNMFTVQSKCMYRMHALLPQLCRSCLRRLRNPVWRLSIVGMQKRVVQASKMWQKHSMPWRTNHCSCPKTWHRYHQTKNTPPPDWHIGCCDHVSSATTTPTAPMSRNGVWIVPKTLQRLSAIFCTAVSCGLSNMRIAAMLCMSQAAPRSVFFLRSKSCYKSVNKQQ